jgi:D-3-phosphoglycerate dehydrogenase
MKASGLADQSYIRASARAGLKILQTRLTDARSASTLFVPMKIIVADKISPHGVQLLANSGWQVSQPAASALVAELADADALIVRSATRVTDELLQHAPRLRIVGRAGVGVDNIDLDAATHRGILVVNTPGSSATSVAEHALALMLALARSVPQLNAAMHAGRWEKSGAAGAELRGKTLGLVGLGRVGGEVARRAKALEMRVLAHDPYLSAERAAEWGVQLLPLAEMLAQADYVSLHTALSPATDRLMNQQTLAQMKRGARLINTARGELVDEAALLEALQSGHIAGAGLDVFVTEPPGNSPLMALPNVIATPHVAGSTAEAQEEVGVQIAQQIRDFLAEGVLRNAVNLPAISPEHYRRLRPYLELAERLASFVAQAAPFGVGRLRLACAGEPAELGTHLLRSAALAGVLNAVLDQRVNLVSAPARAAERGLIIEETTRPRQRGIADLVEITATPAGGSGSTTFSAQGTVLYGTTPRVLGLNGIAVESSLEGTLLMLSNRDVPGVIGEIGTLLGREGFNIATFALGRREAVLGADALALIGLDGAVSTNILDLLHAIPNVIQARIVRLPARVAALDAVAK